MRRNMDQTRSHRTRANHERQQAEQARFAVSKLWPVQTSLTISRETPNNSRIASTAARAWPQETQNLSLIQIISASLIAITVCEVAQWNRFTGSGFGKRCPAHLIVSSPVIPLTRSQVAGLLAPRLCKLAERNAA